MQHDGASLNFLFAEIFGSLPKRVSKQLIKFGCLENQNSWDRTLRVFAIRRTVVKPLINFLTFNIILSDSFMHKSAPTFINYIANVGWILDILM